MAMEPRLRVLDTVASTNDEAFEDLAAGRARHGDAYRARAQTAGRGRLGRRWESAPGEGLYLSLVFAPETPPRSPAAITMAAGLAVRDAVLELGLGDARLAWPNDVYAGSRKLAGILVESRDARPKAFVVGVGLNVRQRGFPPELDKGNGATSLFLEGADATVEAACESVMAKLGERLNAVAAAGPGVPPGASPIERDYLAATGLRGERVRVRRGEDACEGVLEDINLREGICLRRADGWLTTVPVEHASALEALPG